MATCRINGVITGSFGGDFTRFCAANPCNMDATCMELSNDINHMHGPGGL
jgi:hypothetical protein